jgi:hypothetical protein
MSWRVGQPIRVRVITIKQRGWPRDAWPERAIALKSDVARPMLLRLTRSQP